MIRTPDNRAGSYSPEGKERLLLVVDAETTHLYYTGILLQRLAYTIYTATTAAEALEIMAITKPALVLTEAVLPKMSGVEFLKEIKRNPRMNSIPVIIYTSSKDPAMPDACKQAGCAAYLVKPLGPEALYSAIQKVTEEKPRSFMRLNILLRVHIGDAAEKGHPEEYITALSESGAYISTTHPRPVGARLRMAIDLKGVSISVEGSVLYSFAPGTGPLRTPGMGIKFDRVTARDNEVIRSFIHEQVTQNIIQK